jgi:hypothetical protein
VQHRQAQTIHRGSISERAQMAVGLAEALLLQLSDIAVRIKTAATSASFAVF